MKSLTLFVNSNQNVKALKGLIEAWLASGVKMLIWSSEASLLAIAKTSHLPFKKYLPWPKRSNWTSGLVIIFLSPILFIGVSLGLLFLKKTKNLMNIMAFSRPEKIIITPLAKLIGINMIWLESPSGNRRPGWLEKKLSSWALLMVFSEHQKQELSNQGIAEDKIKAMRYGIKLKEFQHQDTIFSQIAESTTEQHNKKFFTVGTVLDLPHLQNTETLLTAIKKCLTVIPNIQVIIIGDGPARRDLKWLSRRMEIDNLTWFVGGQKILKRWFTNFDVYVVACLRAELNDINITLHAAAAGLPIIAPADIGLNEIVQDETTGLTFNLEDSEALAQKIIYSQQNRRARIQLGKNAQKLASQNYTLKSVIPDYLKLFSS